jgi:uncharacterized protein with HEPN domain
MSRDNASVLDIVRSARHILEFTRDMDFEEFEQDLKTQLAILRLLTVMGEATKRISREFRAEHVDVPWREMSGTRDVLVHDYDDVRLKRIWAICPNNIPALLESLEGLVPDVDG